VAQSEPPIGGAQPKEQGIRKAVKELGINRNEAQRAVKIARKPVTVAEPPHSFQARSSRKEASVEADQELLGLLKSLDNALESISQTFAALRISIERNTEDLLRLSTAVEGILVLLKHLQPMIGEILQRLPQADTGASP
jgi:hypothetical protein